MIVDKSEPGDKAYFEGYENSAKEISFESFLKLNISVRDSKAYFEGKELRTDKEIVRVEKVKDGRVR